MHSPNSERLCIALAFLIYALAGREIFRRRRQLRSSSDHDAVHVENPFTSYKTTEIQITSEAANVDQNEIARRQMSTSLNPFATPHEGPGYDQYSVTIERSLIKRSPWKRQSRHERDLVALEANAAAWGYTKVAVLFFISLIITWVSTQLLSLASVLF